MSSKDLVPSPIGSNRLYCRFEASLPRLAAGTRVLVRFEHAAAEGGGGPFNARVRAVEAGGKTYSIARRHGRNLTVTCSW